MKKLMITAALAAFAMGAQAELSAGIGYELNTGYTGEIDMKDTNLSYYKLYSLSSTELKTITGLDTLTAGGVTGWLFGNNYYSKKSDILKVASKWELKTDAVVNDIAVSKTGDGFLVGALKGETITDNDWAILFYSDGVGEDSFRVAHATPPSSSDPKFTVSSDGSVVGLEPGGFLYRGGDSGVVSYGEWTAVPEPTSGLLLLLGVAGLALKRKRA